MRPREALNTKSAVALTRMLRDGDTSPVDVASAVVDRVAAREEAVHAWAYFDPVSLLEAADRLQEDASARRGQKLYGVPLGVKDLIDTADAPCAYGSTRHRRRRPLEDASSVRACRAAGALVAGKTVTTTLTLPVPPATRNPLRLSRSPGGSSAGSAAAVADFMVPIALGTQTAGSIVRPASYCGVLGFVPSRMRWELSGVYQVSPSLDRLGVFTRDFDDLRLVVSVLDGNRQPTGTSPSRSNLRIGLMSDADKSAPDLRALLSGLGQVREIPSDRLLESGARIHSDLMDAEMREALQSETTALDDYEQPTHSLLAALRDRVGREVADLHDETAAFSESIRPLIADLDVIVSSAVHGEAPAARDSVGDPFYCRAWSLLGLPVLSVPLCVGQTGMPVGLQIVGTVDSDAFLIDFAETLQTLVPASERIAWVR